MKDPFSLTFEVDMLPWKAALLSLENISKTSPKIVHRFLDGLDSLTQLIRIDPDRLTADRAGEYRVVFQPTDLLVEFLLTNRTGDSHVL